jgi:hypothetical protein
VRFRRFQYALPSRGWYSGLVFYKARKRAGEEEMYVFQTCGWHTNQYDSKYARLKKQIFCMLTVFAMLCMLL